MAASSPKKKGRKRNETIFAWRPLPNIHSEFILFLQETGDEEAEKSLSITLNIIIPPMYWLPKAAATDPHKLVGLRQQK